MLCEIDEGRVGNVGVGETLKALHRAVDGLDELLDVADVADAEDRHGHDLGQGLIRCGRGRHRTGQEELGLYRGRHRSGLQLEQRTVHQSGWRVGILGLDAGIHNEFRMNKRSRGNGMSDEKKEKK